MLIKVYDGVIDTSKISVLTPVLKNDLNAPGQIKDLKNMLYVFQITIDGSRVNCSYTTEAEAKRERQFVLAAWLATRAQPEVANVSDWEKEQKGAGDESNKII